MSALELNKRKLVCEVKRVKEFLWTHGLTDAQLASLGNNCAHTVAVGKSSWRLPCEGNPIVLHKYFLCTNCLNQIHKLGVR